MKNQRKRVLISGPIGDFGGRELESDIIVTSLKKEYDVSLFSTSFLTKKSFAIKHLKNNEWTSALDILSKNLILKTFAIVSKLKSNRIEPYQFFIRNNLSKKLINLDKLMINEIKKKIIDVDIVFLLVNLKSKFLKEIIEICLKTNKVCIVRTVGTIEKLDKNTLSYFHHATIFVHHSKTNANRLNEQKSLPYEIIDQCAPDEEKLLDLKIDHKRYVPIFGYIGRIANGKGILKIIDFFKSLDKDYKLIVAGDGPLLKKLINNIRNEKRIRYVGIIDPINISEFYKKIDILIIPSLAETGPLIGIEAMAAGKLILSTDVGAMSERLIYLETFFFDINSFDSFESQMNIIYSLNESAKNKIAEKYRERYKEKYCRKLIKKQYTELIKSVIH